MFQTIELCQFAGQEAVEYEDRQELEGLEELQEQLNAIQEDVKKSQEVSESETDEEVPDDDDEEQSKKGSKKVEKTSKPGTSTTENQKEGSTNEESKLADKETVQNRLDFVSKMISTYMMLAHHVKDTFRIIEESISYPKPYFL